MSFNIDDDLNEPLLPSQPSPQQQQQLSPQQHQWQQQYVSFQDPQQPGYVDSIRNQNYCKYAGYVYINQV